MNKENPFKETGLNFFSGGVTASVSLPWPVHSVNH